MCGKFWFHNDAPMLMYCQKLLNSCCFSSLAQAFASIKTNADNTISFHIEEYLKSKVGNHIYFANAILKNEIQLKVEPRVYYSLSRYKKNFSYYILTDISEHVTLVQFMDYLVNVNHAISVVGYWIFDSNYETSLVLNRESFDMICAPSVVEEQVAYFY